VDFDRQSTVAVTLASYEQGVEAYLDASNPTPHPPYEEFLHRVVSLLPAGSRMLELGSGPGDDALFFEHHGLLVRRTDGTRAFVERLRSNGHQADVLDVTTDEFGGPFDVVFANAVLLHLTVDQFDTVLAKAARAVHPDGLLVFTVKEGDGTEWTTTKLDRPRYFTYWRETAMRAHLTTAGWTAVSIEQVNGRLEPWLYVICTPQPR
jgi:predicted TPR repeat methyltransferase